jgi:hypothetical protein
LSRFGVSRAKAGGVCLLLVASSAPGILVAAQSQLIGELSREIYNELARHIRS